MGGGAILARAPARASDACPAGTASSLFGEPEMFVDGHCESLQSIPDRSGFL
jgi:hypothetical protein